MTGCLARLPSPHAAGAVPTRIRSRVSRLILFIFKYLRRICSGLTWRDWPWNRAAAGRSTVPFIRCRPGGFEGRVRHQSGVLENRMAVCRGKDPAEGRPSAPAQSRGPGTGRACRSFRRCDRGSCLDAILSPERL